MDPKHALIRYELLEFIIRLAIDKYINHGGTELLSEAV